MMSSIIQALLHQNSAQYEWARKETTKNLWLTLHRNQAKQISEIIEVYFWPPSSPDFYALEYTI